MIENVIRRNKNMRVLNAGRSKGKFVIHIRRNESNKSILNAGLEELEVIETTEIQTALNNMKNSRVS